MRECDICESRKKKLKKKLDKLKAVCYNPTGGRGL